MLLTVKTASCPHCESTRLVKNGKTSSGSQRYQCKDCGKSRVLKPKRTDLHRPAERAHPARLLRGHEPSRLGAHLRRGPADCLRLAQEKAEAPLKETLQPAGAGDVLELDEVWSFVRKKANKRWLWVALCRRTRQVAAFFLGDRGEDSCRRLYEGIPESYRQCQSFSDFWAAYQKVFPDETHQPTEKGSGETSRLERWNLHIRQRLARFGLGAAGLFEVRRLSSVGHEVAHSRVQSSCINERLTTTVARKACNRPVLP